MLFHDPDSHTLGHEFLGEVVALGSNYGKNVPERPKLYSWLSCTPSTTNTIRSVYIPFPETDEEHSSVDNFVAALSPSLAELRFAVYGMLPYLNAAISLS